MEPTATYRADIDGLRAVAVLLVVLYHFGLGPSGGFAGVDIFFVISGYLITSIIYKEMAHGQFSLLRFYERRLRRILPILLVVIVCSLAAGYWLLPAGTLKSLGWQAATAVTGTSNIYFRYNTGYFAQAAATLPLLHTWSLGIEEQFYVLWPVMLWTWIAVIGPKRLWVALPLAIGVAATFAISAYLTPLYETFSFFMLPTRAWELALGALLVFLPTIRSSVLSELIGALGALLIGLTAFMLSEANTYPGVNALAPCLGAALIIWPKSTGSLIGKALSVKPAVFVGLISYSLYLWHWPLIVFFETWNFGDANATEGLALLCTALGLSYLSWRFIERPFRRHRSAKNKSWRPILAGVASAALVASLGSMFALQNGFPSRLSEEALEAARQVSQSEPRREECFVTDERWIDPAEPCRFGNAPVSDWVLWGDSHSLSLAHGLKGKLGQTGQSFLYYGQSGCAPVQGHQKPRCLRYNKLVLEEVLTNTKAKTVVLAARWGQIVRNGPAAEIAAQLTQDIQQLIDSGKHVILVYPTPVAPFSVPGAASQFVSMGRNPDLLTLDRSYVDGSEVGDAIKMLNIVPDLRGLRRVHPLRTLCSKDDCRLWSNKMTLFYDNQHLSLYGSEIVARSIFSAQI